MSGTASVVDDHSRVAQPSARHELAGRLFVPFLAAAATIASGAALSRLDLAFRGGRPF